MEAASRCAPALLARATVVVAASIVAGPTVAVGQGPGRGGRLRRLMTKVA
ncbi:MAG: hypothetical protein M3083_04490 [Actinomycetota bacterium]|nr:hypothetical protein [Actinomycetota bacterium]